MTARATPEKISVADKPVKPARSISWPAFQRKYLTREDRYKYEWVDGQVEKTARTMDKNQFYIQMNLLRFLNALRQSHPIDGELIAEGDTFFASNHRRPDLAYYTEAQILQGARNENIVPRFVIEIISNSDQMYRVHKKMQDYHKAGVEVIWHIFPELGEVHVYRGRKMEMRQGNDLCSAEPVVEGFKMTVQEVLKKES